MKLYLKFIKNYLNFLSIIAPKYGGKVAVKLFQKVRHKKIKKRELNFYDKATHFKVKRANTEYLHCYEFGNPNGELIFLIHGWDSNAGSLSEFETQLSKNNYRVISLDLPAHSNTNDTHTNLYECKEAFKTLIAHINPQEKFSVIGHSFGSAVLAYALSDVNYQIDKIILLSANNRIIEIFRDYQKILGFNEKIFNQIRHWTKKIIKENLSEMIITDKLKKINFDELLIIHDKFDKVIPYHNATQIAHEVLNSKLITHEKIGHYRMLWNQSVVKETLIFINSKNDYYSK